MQANAWNFSFFWAARCERINPPHIRPKSIVAMEGVKLSVS